MDLEGLILVDGTLPVTPYVDNHGPFSNVSLLDFQRQQLPLKIQLGRLSKKHDFFSLLYRMLSPSSFVGGYTRLLLTNLPSLDNEYP